MEVVRLNDGEGTIDKKPYDDPSCPDYNICNKTDCDLMLCTTSLQDLLKIRDPFVINVVSTLESRLDVPALLHNTMNGEPRHELVADKIYMDQHTSPMVWAGQPDAPARKRNRGDVLQLFFSSFTISNQPDIQAIHFWWTDKSSEKVCDVQVKSDYRQLVVPSGSFSTYLLFYGNRNALAFLSETPYSRLMLEKDSVAPDPMECYICTHSFRSLMRYRCGHVECYDCCKILAKCSVCGRGKPVPGLEDQADPLVVRDGLCQYDWCSHIAIKQNGVRVNPCGCFLSCPNLREQLDRDQNTMPFTHCPFDACGEIVWNLQKVTM